MDALVLETLSNKHCGPCILFKSREHIGVRDETVKMNAKYVPEKIKILFIAESPPWDFVKDKRSYFYAPGQIQYGGLSYHIMSVLFKEKFYIKEHFLQKFVKSGFYLIDMVKCPINKLTKREKEKAFESCAKYLNEELHSLNFEKAIFVGKSSFKIVKNHLNLDFNYAVIPFPRFKKNVEGFKEGLKKALMQPVENNKLIFQMKIRNHYKMPKVLIN